MGKPENTKPGVEASTPFSSPSISLPKGGGAIRGIGEKFAANPVTGTGSMSVPLSISPGRSGFGPQLSLSYDSGAGNGPFGLGWTLSLPAITRKTDTGLPEYRDAEESDVYVLSGAEDLVPVLQPDGTRFKDDKTAPGYVIHRYRPRIEGLFARIERWTKVATGEIHWRSISRDNVTTLYGKDNNSRVFDPLDPTPANPTHIFSWLICESHDDKGNAIVYEYVEENDEAVVRAQANERNRVYSANRYLKRVKYGNRVSRLIRPDLTQASWLFEVVFDYEEGHYEEVDLDPAKPKAEKHEYILASSQPATPWAVRPDPFSFYRAGFEVRTCRRCSRILMFHHIPDLPTGEKGYDGLVRSTELDYADLDYQQPVAIADELSHQGSTRFASFVRRIRQSGYLRDDSQPVVIRDGVPYASYLKKSLPPLEFEYSKATIRDDILELDSDSLENLPIGLDGGEYQWVDLHGEGIPGILTEQEGAWFYKRNLSPLSLPDSSSGSIRARLAPAERVAAKPSLDLARGRMQFMDLAGDGQPDVVALEGPQTGLYEHDDKDGWQPFRPFTSHLCRDTRDANLRFIDLDGDGHADVLVTEDDAFTWHPSLGEEGFGPARRVAHSWDEEKGPRLVFADGAQSIYLADMCGDGLTDLVRIRNGEVCYWPNLGYGRFGAKVTMDNPPWFDRPDLFDQRRVRLADIDGSGANDIVYLHRDGARLYFNQSGNRLSDARCLDQFPRMDDVSSVLTADLLGNGTACLVWSSPLPADARRPLHYIDLIGGTKPHLLIKVVNNLGAETEIHYAPSTRFCLADKWNGRPWVSRLPFPVHVVQSIITHDRVSGNQFVSRYAYHHGYFDGIEREFRGFGMVEQWDTEELAALNAGGQVPVGTNVEASSHVPPVLTKTWFHTGTYLGRKHASDFFAGLLTEDDVGEYYREPGLTDAQAAALLLEDTILPDGLTVEEEREACRALKGSMLRQEIFALDGTDKQAHPYTVTEQNFTIRMLQGRGGNSHGVFFTYARESISYHYDRDPSDPRIGHALTLEVDDFGNVLKSAVVGYGRRQPDTALATADQARQTQILVTYTENRVTKSAETADHWRTPLLCETRTYEMTGFKPESAPRFSFDEWTRDEFALTRLAQEIPYEQTANNVSRQKRLIEHVRTLYRSDDLTALLPLGDLEPLALPGDSYKLAFTPGLVAEVYNGRVGDALLETEGRYVHSDGDANWWIPSGRIFYSPDTDATPVQELAQARQHFFLPLRYRDPFHTPAAPTENLVSYDTHDLLVQETRDALGNRVTAGERDLGPTLPLARHGLDYRVLQAGLVMDSNRNRSAVAFDALGMVAGTAVRGKPEENPVPGDRFTPGFRSDLTQAEIDQFFANPCGPVAATLLDDATTRIVYDLAAYWREPDPARKPPVVAAVLARETHAGEPEPPGGLRIQASFSYSDGFGREIQRKIQAEPGHVPARDAEGKIIVEPDGQPQMTPEEISPRWVGSGWTVFNNKGKPVRQYEPFFTDTHRFEFDVRIGVSPVLLYDPVERTVATLHPNHTWEKMIFTPWRQETWDVNDTVLQMDPKVDADVGAFFSRLADNDYLPPWHALRTDPALALEAEKQWPDPKIRDAERSAAEKTSVHAATPTVAHADSLGRTFLSVERNRLKYSNTPSADPPVEELYSTRVNLDIEGNQREVIDAHDRVVVRYDYDLLGNRIHQVSMEAGERWMLSDVAGKPLYAWDSRGHRFRTAYDPLRRPTDQFLREGAGAEMTVGRTVYGESQPDPEVNNLRGKVVQLFDQAGVVNNESYDFKGNLLSSRRRLAKEYKATLDWSAAASLEPDTYSSRTRYDALNRPVELTAPDGSMVRPRYNEANLLERLEANLRGEQQDGSPVWTLFVGDIDYDAKGQRTLIDFGNGVRTSYEYDPFTYRLIHLVSRRDAAAFPGDCPQPPPAGWPGCQVQNLNYTYDGAGNITSIRDDAQQTVYFRNKRVEPSAEYTYDALNRLIEATGREHLGQVGGSPVPHSNNDVPRVGLNWSANDGNAMGTYIERYIYDAVGNLLEMQHRGSDPAHDGWTRTYAYNETSLIEPARQSNRLTSTSIGVGNPITERYVHDVHGNVTRMTHLGGLHPDPNMHWNYRDQLRQVDLGGGGTAYYTYDAAGQRVRKVWEKSAGLVEERIYLGGLEVYRRRQGPERLERETLHIMDDKQRIVLVETRTLDTAGVDTAPGRLIRYQFCNHLGSASLELDDQAEIISYEEYTPYGSTSYQAVRSQTETPKRYRFTGKERDEESGLYYHGARYYAPWLGRWTSCDPAGLVDGPNLYLYVRASPVRFRDPGGTQAKPGTVDYQIMTMTDSQLHTRLQAMTAEQRGTFLSGATGAFRTRAESMRTKYGMTAIYTLPEVTVTGTPPTVQSAEATQPPSAAPLSPEQLRDKVALLPFFFHGPWGQYVRTYQDPPQGAPVGLAALRQLNAGAPLAVANFSRDVAPGTAVENLTLLTVTAMASGAGTLQAAGQLNAQEVAQLEALVQKAIAAKAAAQKVAGPGSFGAEDVAFGLARPGGKSGVLVRFAGEAQPGTRAPLSDLTRELPLGPTRNAVIAEDTLRFAQETIQRTGGRLRFNLTGVNVQEALTPGSRTYGSVTSAELRGVLNNAELLQRTSFYDEAGVDITQKILSLAGPK